MMNRSERRKKLKIRVDEFDIIKIEALKEFVKFANTQTLRKRIFFAIRIILGRV